MVDVAADGGRRRLELGGAGIVQLEVGRIDDHVRPGQLAELAHLDRGPGRLHGAAPADDEDLADPRAVDRLDRGVRRVRGGQLFRREGQHPRDVQRDIAVSDHNGSFAGEVERELLEVGMAVVPGDELGRGPRARQVFSGDSELPVCLRADGIDDRVIEMRELGVLDVLADLDVAEEAEAGLRGGALERARDGLDVRMVGGDAEAHEAPRSRQPFDHVDLDLEIAREQCGGSVEPSRAGADHGDAKGISRVRESRVVQTLTRRRESEHGRSRRSVKGGGRGSGGGGLGDLLGGILGGGARGGSLAGGGGLGGNPMLRMLLPMVGGMLMNGGLQKILSRLQSQGKGETAQSWVGTGANEPIDAGDVREALDDDELDRIAQQLGVSKDDAAAAVATGATGRRGPGVSGRTAPGGRRARPEVRSPARAGRREDRV